MSFEMEIEDKLFQDIRACPECGSEKSLSWTLSKVGSKSTIRHKCLDCHNIWTRTSSS